MTEPSKVIHVRNVGHEISENDLLQLFQPFGVITKLVMLRAKNQALLQMQDVPSAINALQLYTNIQPTIRGRNVYVQFSSHQELTTMDQNTQGRGDEVAKSNSVSYNTSHALSYYSGSAASSFFSPWICGEDCHVSEVGWFSSPYPVPVTPVAVQARTSLQGRNIYDGCCQLDIQFSNLDELQVNYNNDRSRDFTNPNLPSEQKGRSSQQPAYGDVGMHALKTTGVRGCADLEVTMSCYSLLSLRINSFFFLFPMQLDILLRWVLLRSHRKDYLSSTCNIQDVCRP
ncbi:hypothetical protein NC651_004712 [Populus alba x Populus x berolinensis]|nr:hypothetical protein NC651_004712 [Populus alba x Populus x berolinensis]